MDIKDLIPSADVLQDLRALSKRRVLEILARHAAAAHKLDAASVLNALLAREELGSTGMGEGVAIPHARLPEVQKSFGVFARLKTAVDFAAIDGHAVDVVCLLLLPTRAQGEQLNALAAVARRLRDGRLTQRLREAPDVDTLYRLLSEEL